MGSASASADKVGKKDSPYSSSPYRWRFLEASDGEDYALKIEYLRKIDAFWNKFVQDKDLLASCIGKKSNDVVPRWVHENLHAIDKNLMWEMGVYGKSGYKLDITSETDVPLRVLVEAIISKAPKIPGWTFSAYRRPIPISDVADLFLGRRKRELKPFSATFSKGVAKNVEVNILSSGFSEPSCDDDLADAFILCEIVLGEENLDRWIGPLGTKKLASIDDSKKSLNIDIERFAKGFEDQKNIIKSQLPPKPCYETTFEQKPEIHRFARTVGNKTGKTVLSTLRPDVVLDLENNAVFYSERYSRHGEHFCYFQIRRAASGFETRLPDVKKAFDEALRRARVGCCIGHSSGPSGHFTVELCLADVDKAIPILRRLSKQFSLPHSATLRFYDTIWQHEWVGMFQDTPKPDDLEHTPLISR